MRINDDPLIEVIARAESEFYREPLNSFASLPAALAAAVRSFMGSETVVERALRARYHAAGSFWPDAVSEGMQRVERMIMEKTLEGALSAAIGEDIGGGRG